ncbi:diguanylate cyclase [Massilia sp. PAMC28688]|uniref:ligand-binding sensor domain-containing diguanylate cyclase n=1 Tax=Massilia sp. PAMC28688 TaxID=2861283 RepID=UPI001C62CF09|nr:ligand-binding sensor domain-containing diguanylate cyclase [Massilia sp. PAMC28688]QYF93229.1 diguanylate cyclase [Massilia sp. PAMC28688]
MGRHNISRLLVHAAVWLAALCACAPAFALDPGKAFHHYVRNTWSIQHGLPQISASAIVQDHQGYIWVATQAGLARFDGVKFTNYVPETHPGLTGLWVRTLLVDGQGRLWIGTYKGLSLYQNGSFSAIPTADGVKFPTVDINAILEDRGGIVAATTDGLFDLVDGKLVHRAGSPAPATSVMRNGAGLWIGTLGAVHRQQGAVNQALPLPQGMQTGVVTRLADAHGKVWAGTSLGLMVLNEGQWEHATDSPVLRTSPITMLYEDSNRTLWVASNAGLGRLRDGVLTEVIPEKHPAGIKGIISAFEDRERNLWMGSQWQGLIRLWNGSTRRLSTTEGLNDPIVWSVARGPDGRTWVGTNDGLSVFAGGRFTTVLRGDQLPHPHAYNLLADADRIWIGTRRGLVIWQDGKVVAPPEYAPMASSQINGIVRDSDGVMWFPTSDGLFSHDGSAMKHYGKDEGLNDIRVRQIRELKDGRLLVATQDGLYEKQGERLVQLGLNTGLRGNLDVTAITELKGGEIVIGTLSEEMFMFNGKRWTRFGRAQGFPANTPFFLTEDNAGYLWAAGIRGITRAPLAEMRQVQAGKASTAYAQMVMNERGDRRSGEQGFCCNGAGNAKGFIDPAGVLWLPSRDGVVTVDTLGLQKNATPPTAVIERVRVLDQWQDVRAAQAYHLDSEARDLAFEFTALSFQDPGSVVLRYRLLGYDKDWRELDGGMPRAVNYTNLPPGSYSFEIKASNNADVWSTTPARLDFTIAPHFYETGWFKALVAAMLAALVYLGYLLQRRAHERQRAELAQQVAERTQQLHVANLALELASQTDPLTGLHNRRYLSNQIPADLAFYERETRRGSEDNTLLFALVDIDHFKRINDTYGHKAGDRVLQQVSEVLRRQVRVGDYLVRWGGEEFLLVCRPSTAQFVPVLGERIREAVAGHSFDLGDGVYVSLTCSIGLAESGQFLTGQYSVGWEQLVELADAALYWVKENGRNGWAALRPNPDVNIPELIEKLHLGAQTMIDTGRVVLMSSHDGAPGQQQAPAAHDIVI